MTQSIARIRAARVVHRPACEGVDNPALADHAATALRDQRRQFQAERRQIGELLVDLGKMLFGDQIDCVSPSSLPRSVRGYPVLNRSIGQGSGAALIAGASTAILEFGVIAWAMLRYSRELPIATFFRYSSWQMAALIFVFTGKGAPRFKKPASSTPP